MNQREIRAYAAGIIDGEGNIYVARTRTGYVRVSVRNTNLEVLEWLREQFGGQIAHNRDDRPNRRPCFTWYLNYQDSLEFLSLVEPYLIIKRDKARAILASFI
jgi:hypothetical protein